MLFKTIENKEYLNVKRDPVKEEKKSEEGKPVTPGPGETSEKENEKTEDKENDDQISSTEEKQNGVQIQSSVVSEGSIAKVALESENKLNDGKDDKKKENVS